MNFWIKVFQEFCSFPHLAQLSFYCSGYIHFVIFLPVCLLLVSIKYLLLLYSLTSSALLPHSHFPPYSSEQVIPIHMWKGTVYGFTFLMISLLRPSNLQTFFCGLSLLSLYGDALISTFPSLVLSFCPIPSKPSPRLPLCWPSLHLTPWFRTLLRLRSACWNIRWTMGAEAAAGVSAWPGGGVSEVGAISTLSRQQWWWSSARCSLAPLVLCRPPSPPPSSLDPIEWRIVQWS